MIPKKLTELLDVAVIMGDIITMKKKLLIWSDENHPSYLEYDFV